MREDKLFIMPFPKIFLAKLRKGLGNLRYEHWLAIVGILLLCLVATLAVADNQGLIDYESNYINPVSYDDLCPFGKEQIQLMNGKQIQRWIYDKYHVTPSESTSGIDETITLYTFNQYKTLRYLSLRTDHPFLLTEDNIENGSTFRQIVAGLGTPERVYHENYVPVVREATAVTIGLDYPKLGVSVWSTRWETGDHEQSADQLSENLRATGLYCYIPNQSMEDILKNVFGYRPDDIDSAMKKRMPWPGFGVWLP